MLEDGSMHQLPASSVHAWQWGGGSAVEIELSVDGTVELTAGRYSRELAGERGRFRLERLRLDAGADELAVRAGPDGAAVTDLFVYVRS
jgi:hypothetical protein